MKGSKTLLTCFFLLVLCSLAGVTQNIPGEIERVKTLLKERKFEEGISAATLVLEKEPMQGDFLLLRAKCFLSTRKYPLALKDLDEYIQKFPPLSEAFALRAEVYLNLNAIGFMNEDLSQALKLDEKNARSLSLKGYVLMNQGLVADAMVVLKASIRADSTLPGAYKNLGDCYAKLEKFPLAQQTYDYTILRFPKYWITYYARGVLNLRLNKVNNAISDFDQAIVLEPSYAHSYNDRGYCKLVTGQLDSSIRDFKKAIELSNPVPPTFRLNLINALGQLNRYAEAIFEVNVLIGVSPLPLYFFLRGVFLNKILQYSKAVDDFDNVIGKEPSPQAYYYRAHCRFHLGEPSYPNELVLEDVEMAITFGSMDPELGKFYLLKGLVYQRMMEVDLACVSLSRAASLKNEEAIRIQNLYCK